MGPRADRCVAHEAGAVELAIEVRIEDVDGRELRGRVVVPAGNRAGPSPELHRNTQLHDGVLLQHLPLVAALGSSEAYHRLQEARAYVEHPLAGLRVHANQRMH